MQKNIALIGAGPGGYVAAIRLAQLNHNVTLFEYDKVGGTCLNRGCIPTKTYFKNAQIMKDLKERDVFGINLSEDPSIDPIKLVERKYKVVNSLVTGIHQLISSYPNITFINDIAKFESNKVLSWDDGNQKQEFDNIIIASGSKPKFTETEGISLPGVITSDDLLELKEIPKSMVIIGAGVIGLEFASIYNVLGSKIYLLASRVLKDADGEIQKRIVPILKKEGVEIFKDIRAEKIEKVDGSLKVTAKYKNKEKFEEIVADYVLVASGRAPNIEKLSLENTSIEFDESKGIYVNDNFETSVSGVYAIGDVNSRGIQLAHVASAQGEFVAALISGIKPEVNLDVYPACTFTLTEVAQVGETEESLKEKNIEYKTSKFPFIANGKALSLNESQGFIKLIQDREGYLLGAHILGPHANDLISECALVIANHGKTDLIRHTIHAHPTLSEGVMEAANDLFDEAIHVQNKKPNK